MPTYDYGCDKCEVEFELRHSMADKPRVKCPLCGKRAKKRIPKTFNFSVRGTRVHDGFSEPRVEWDPRRWKHGQRVYTGKAANEIVRRAKERKRRRVYV